jgi:hypothetical protein
MLRSLSVGLVLVGVAFTTVGCTQSDSAPNRSTVTPTHSPVSSSAPTSPSPTPSRTSVPVDQIPPGRPASWVPAGVPTTAKWREPGDVVPTFTPAMFKNDENGALAAAQAYLTGVNWALATLDPKSYLVICDAARCKSNARITEGYRSKNQHVKAARASFEAPTLFVAPKGNAAQWIVRVKLSIHAGSLVSADGKTVRKQGAMTERVDVYARWSGRMWRISDVFLAN